MTVRAGPLWQLAILQGALEEAGIPAFVPDAAMKTWDPFATGANALEGRLQVPDCDAERAREVIQVIPPAADEEPAEGAAEPSPIKTLEDLGRRIRWASLLVLFHPVLPFYGLRYLRGLRRVTSRPSGHAWTMAALGVTSAVWATVLLLLTIDVFKHGHGAFLLRWIFSTP